MSEEITPKSSTHWRLLKSSVSHRSRPGAANRAGDGGLIGNQQLLGPGGKRAGRRRSIAAEHYECDPILPKVLEPAHREGDVAERGICQERPASHEPPKHYEVVIAFKSDR